MITDMTEGNIPKHLISYSIPLILGNLFQLTYNAVDSIIVGRFIGKEALAAVGVSSPVMNIIILGISGTYKALNSSLAAIIPKRTTTKEK